MLGLTLFRAKKKKKKRLLTKSNHPKSLKTSAHMLPTPSLRITWIHRVQSLIILNLDLRLRALLIDRQRTVLADQMPLALIIRGRLTGHDRMFPNPLVVALRRLMIDLLLAIRVAGELLIQRSARKLAPVKARRLLRCVIAEADRDHFLAVGGAEVEAVGRLFVAQLLLLQVHDLDDGVRHGVQHVLQGIFFLPRVFGSLARQIGDVQRRRMLGVGAAQHVAVSIVGHEVRHIAADIREVGDGAIVHEDVAAKDKGVAVHLCDDAATRSTDMGKEAIRLGVDAETSEVEIVNGRGLGLVESGPGTSGVLFVVGSCIGVPGDAEPVHVEEAVAHLKEAVLGVVQLVLFSVGKELGEVVLGALL